MPIQTVTNIIDDSDGTTVIDPTLPYVTIVDTAGNGETLYFQDWNAVAKYAAAQQPIFEEVVTAAKAQIVEQPAQPAQQISQQLQP